MWIPDSTQMKAWDAATLAAQGITSWQLMERAAAACAGWIAAHFGTEHPALVLCGRGGNGGDGLALARLLLREGYAVRVLLLAGDAGLPEATAKNLHILRQGWPDAVEEIDFETVISSIPDHLLLIDALWGIGARPVKGEAAQFIERINLLGGIRIAIDLPSGMQADALPEGPVFQAHYTLTLHTWKQSMLHPESKDYPGNVHVLDIGLDSAFAAEAGPGFQTIDETLIQGLYRPRPCFTHKGLLGTAVIAGGSKGMMGAALLAARAAGRAGAGKVRVIAPKAGYEILQTGVPEAMCITSGEDAVHNILDQVHEGETLGIGPGMGEAAETAQALRMVLKAWSAPLVLDASALNILGKEPDLLSTLPRNSILTPHPKEFERMFGKTTNSLERLTMAQNKSKELGCYIVLKDRYSTIVCPEGRVVYNTFGNTGLATGGSGDVLTGIITGLLAQQYTSFAAAVLGVYLHARAGELAAEEMGLEAMLPQDILSQLGKVFLEFHSNHQGSKAAGI